MLIRNYTYMEVSLLHMLIIGNCQKYAYRELCLYRICIHGGSTVLGLWHTQTERDKYLCTQTRTYAYTPTLSFTFRHVWFFLKFVAYALSRRDPGTLHRHESADLCRPDQQHHQKAHEAQQMMSVDVNNKWCRLKSSCPEATWCHLYIWLIFMTHFLSHV